MRPSDCLGLQPRLSITLRATGLVPSGRFFDVLSVDADQKRVKVRVGEHDHLLDYGQVQNLLREVARAMPGGKPWRGSRIQRAEPGSSLGAPV